MSLLMTPSDPATIEIAQRIFDAQLEADPKLDKIYDDRQKRLWFQDILYNITYLSAALHLKDKTIFTRYAIWLFELLCGLMKQFDREQVKDQIVDHFHSLSSEAAQLYGGETGQMATEYIEAAIEATEKVVTAIPLSERFLSGKHVGIRQSYLHALLRSHTRAAIDIIMQARREGIPIDEIYEDILQEVMHEVGELWHHNQITVDKEHYCTSTTQMVLSQFYEEIFSTGRIGHTIVTCCVGTELHEMGGRMVSDFFEYQGWDSIYLGAAVPEEAIVATVAEQHPDLVALSVTMVQHLVDCLTIVHTLRKRFPSLKIAVGGRAFEMTDRLWEQWPVDVYTKSARDLVAWAETHVVKGFQ